MRPSTPNYVIQPRTDLPSAVDFDLESYIIHVRTQHCLRCGKDHKTSEIYEVFINPQLTGRTAAHRLVPAISLKPGYHIGFSNLRILDTPCCHECFSTLDGISAPQVDLKEQQRTEWALTLKRKYAPEATNVERPRPASSKFPTHPTLDDL